MQTAIMKDHDFKGPTRNPNGETLARLTEQFRFVRGPEQVRKCLKAWGLTDEISPRQARFWNESTEAERTVFCDMARVSISHTRNEWAVIPETQREKLWRAVVDATQWGERLKGRF